MPIRLTAGSFFADLIQDARDPRQWIYIVQREGSREIISMGTCIGEQQCKEFARKILADLADQNNENGDAAAAS